MFNKIRFASERASARTVKSFLFNNELRETST